jgi:hypothetical protein
MLCMLIICFGFFCLGVFLFDGLTLALMPRGSLPGGLTHAISDAPGFFIPSGLTHTFFNAPRLYTLWSFHSSLLSIYMLVLCVI